MASRTETYLHRRWEGQAVGFRNQDFIDVVPASASKGEGLRRLVASLAEPPAGETDGVSGTGAASGAGAAPTGEASEAPVGGSAGLGVGPGTAEPVETWSIGDSWNDISMHAAADHSYALPWSPPEVVAQCDGTVSSLADLIDSLMGRPTL